jgi:hypothetical protein
MRGGRNSRVAHQRAAGEQPGARELRRRCSHHTHPTWPYALAIARSAAALASKGSKGLSRLLAIVRSKSPTLAGLKTGNIIGSSTRIHPWAKAFTNIHP